jgi:hypothetical protein
MRLLPGALAILLLFGGCSSRNDEASDSPPSSSAPSPVPTSSTPPSSEPTATPSTSQTTPRDKAQPVSSALIRRLISVANDLGYGPATRGFALLMVDTCRDVESGYSDWDELIDEDVASGAPRKDAEAFYSFLDDEFCVGVASAEDPKQPQGDPGEKGDGTRGLGSSASYLDAQWKHGDLGDCRAATGAPFGEPRAYEVDGVLVCADYIKGGPWGDVFISLDVVIEPPVSEDRARDVVRTLLPADARETTRLEHTNPGWAAHDGSCIGLGFTSETLGDAIRTASPDWSNPEAAVATLYSDKQTNYGSGSVFDGSVHLISLSIGRDAKGDSC